MRASLGLTQEQFAPLINRTRQTIGRWEEGEGLPDDFVLAELARRGGFSPTYFVDDEINLPGTKETAAWRKAYDEAVNGAAALDAAAKDLEKTARAERHRESERTGKRAPSNGNP